MLRRTSRRTGRRDAIRGRVTSPANDCAPDADGPPVGCAMKVGPGRLFLWGDEHVTFEDYRPDSERFWAGALAWLADSGRVSVNDLTGSAVVPAVAATLGRTMAGGEADIVVVDLWRGAAGADIAAWLGEGRAVMVMAIGLGLSAADAPFVNGRKVVADDPSTAGAVAFIH